MFRNEVCAAPELNADHVVDNDETDGERDNEDRDRTRAKRWRRSRGGDRMSSASARMTISWC